MQNPLNSRENRIAELRAQIERGEYHVPTLTIVEAMFSNGPIDYTVCPAHRIEYPLFTGDRHQDCPRCFLAAHELERARRRHFEARFGTDDYREEAGMAEAMPSALYQEETPRPTPAADKWVSRMDILTGSAVWFCAAALLYLLLRGVLV